MSLYDAIEGSPLAIKWSIVKGYPYTLDDSLGWISRRLNELEWDVDYSATATDEEKQFVTDYKNWVTNLVGTKPVAPAQTP